MKQVLQEKGLAEEIQASGVAELGQESKDLLRSLLDRIQGLEQLAPVAESAESHSLKGNAHFGAGELDLAFTEYSLAISLNPEYANAYGNRGAAYGEKGDYDSAIEDFDRAIRLNPEYAQAYYNRGNAYSSKGEHDTAIEDFDRAISLNPDLFQAYTNRSHTYNHIGEYDKAIATATGQLNLTLKQYLPLSTGAWSIRSLGETPRLNQISIARWNWVMTALRSKTN